MSVIVYISLCFLPSIWSFPTTGCEHPNYPTINLYIYGFGTPANFAPPTIYQTQDKTLASSIVLSISSASFGIQPDEMPAKDATVTPVPIQYEKSINEPIENTSIEDHVVPVVSPIQNTPETTVEKNIDASEAANTPSDNPVAPVIGSTEIASERIEIPPETIAEKRIDESKATNSPSEASEKPDVDPIATLPVIPMNQPITEPTETIIATPELAEETPIDEQATDETLRDIPETSDVSPIEPTKEIPIDEQTTDEAPIGISQLIEKMPIDEPSANEDPSEIPQTPDALSLVETTEEIPIDGQTTDEIPSTFPEAPRANPTETPPDATGSNPVPTSFINPERTSYNPSGILNITNS